MPPIMVLLVATRNWGMMPLIVASYLLTMGRMNYNDLFIFPFFIHMFLNYFILLVMILMISCQKFLIYFSLLR
jgi:hypothetical protein